jgi:hypothetical protein
MEENYNVDELAFIDDALTEASQYRLTTEVVWSALQAMKQAPNITIQEAVHHGLSEWIK